MAYARGFSVQSYGIDKIKALRVIVRFLDLPVGALCSVQPSRSGDGAVGPAAGLKVDFKVAMSQ